jgi:hypothetical protein
LFEDKRGQTLKGKNGKPRVTGQGGIGQKLTFQLEGGLLGGQENQWRPVRVVAQGGANLRQAPERLAGAGGTEEKARAHAPLLAQIPAAGKENYILTANGAQSSLLRVLSDLPFKAASIFPEEEVRNMEAET